MHDDLVLLLKAGWSLTLIWDDDRQQFSASAYKPNAAGTLEERLGQSKQWPMEAVAGALVAALAITPRGDFQP